MLTLQLSENGRSQKLQLEQDLITIGRSKENTIVIPNKKVSRKHARIERVGATYQVTDLESGNGTKINGEKVGFHALAKGDEIKIGDALLKVQGIDEGPDRVELDENVGEETGLLDSETPVDGVKTEPDAIKISDDDEIKISGEDDDVTVVEKLDDLPDVPKPAPAPKAAAAPTKPMPKLSPAPGAKPAAAKPGSPSRLEAAKAKLAAMKEKKAQEK